MSAGLALPAVVIDTREQTPWTFLDGIVVVRGTLPTGDYSLVGFEIALAVERKSLADLVACCTAERPRFVRELVRMSTMTMAAVVVEADVSAVHAHAYRSQVLPSSVLGSVASFFVDYGIPVFFAGDRAQAAAFAHSLLRLGFGKATGQR